MKQPNVSYQNIRYYTGKWSWIDRRTGMRTIGYAPPKGAKELQRVPFHIKYVTRSGRLEEGDCVCMRIDRREGRRMIQYITSKQFRWVYDSLIIEIDGTRFFVS